MIESLTMYLLQELSEALISACGSGDETLVRLFLSVPGVDVNRMHPVNCCYLLEPRIWLEWRFAYRLQLTAKAAIHVACEGGFNKIIELLMTHNANVLLRDGRGRSPIDCAIVNKHFEVVELLHERYDISMRLGRKASEVRDDFMQKAPTASVFVHNWLFVDFTLLLFKWLCVWLNFVCAFACGFECMYVLYWSRFTRLLDCEVFSIAISIDSFM